MLSIAKVNHSSIRIWEYGHIFTPVVLTGFAGFHSHDPNEKSI